MNKFVKMKKGIALLWVLMLSIVMMIITSTMVTYMIKEARMSVNIEASTQSYAFARSGIDWGIANPNDGLYSFDMDPASSGDELTVSINYPLVRSTGTVGGVNGVKRAIEYTITTGGIAKIEPSGSLPPNDNKPEFTDISQQINPPTNVSSFKYKFDFWTSSATPPSDSKFGLAGAAGNPSASPYIYINMRGSQAPELVVSNGVDTTPPIPLNLILPVTGDIFPGPSGLSQQDFARYRAEIKYISETSVTATIREKDGGGNYVCIASGTFNLAAATWSNKNLGDLKYVYAAGTVGQTYTTTGIEEDGKYTILDGGANDLFVDNVVLYDRATVAASNYTVTVNKTGAGSGSVASSPAGISGSSYPLRADFTAGSNVILTATPTSGTVTWSGCPSAVANVCTISNISSNTSVTVDFSSGGAGIYLADLESGVLHSPWEKVNNVSVVSSVTDPVGAAISGSRSLYIRGTFEGTATKAECNIVGDIQWPAMWQEGICDGAAKTPFSVPANTRARLKFKVQSSIGNSGFGDSNRVTLYDKDGSPVKTWSTTDGSLITGTSVNYGAITDYVYDLGTSSSIRPFMFFAKSHNQAWQASMLIDDIIVESY